MKLVVYTVLLGGYDNLRPPEVVTDGARYVCFSDEMQWCPPWEIQPAWKPYKSDSRNSRIPKILPHLFFDADVSIYQDASFQLNQNPISLAQSLLNRADLALYKHPCRKNVYEEQRICEREHIGDGPEMTAQVERYRAAGIGYNGLWAGGFIVRRHSAAVVTFNEVWWREFITGCARDQFALPAAIQKTRIPVETINADIFSDTARTKYHFHAAFKDYSDNPSFEADRLVRAARHQKLEELCICRNL